MSGAARDIARMPRGGFDASCLDRRVQTRRLEYLDRDDVGPKKRQVIDALDTVGRVLGGHRRFAHAALREVANVTDPKILELGAGHGGLSRALLIDHPTAEVTVTDVEPASVAAMAAGELGRHRRATVRQMDPAGPPDPRRFHQLAARLQPLGAAGAGRPRRPGHRDRGAP